MDSNNSLIERGFKYLARDEGGALFAYKYKPEKRMRVWVVSEDAEDSEHPHFTQVNDGLGVYDTIQWEDKEPTEIETLSLAVAASFNNPIKFGGLSIHEQKGGGTYIMKSDLYKSVLDQNAEKRKERFNELTGEKFLKNRPMNRKKNRTIPLTWCKSRRTITNSAFSQSTLSQKSQTTTKAARRSISARY